jgi:cell wall-associated NlpC family hydrolase
MNIESLLMYVSRNDIIQEALSWRDVPWKHQGRTRSGLDCAGLIVLVGRALNLIDYDYLVYTRHTNQDKFLQHFRKVLIEKPVKDRQPGDVLLFRDGVQSCHSGIFAPIYNSPGIIHAYAKRRKVVHDTLTPEVLKKMTYCFEFPNMTETP